jgi:hypothetical protein
LPRLKRIGLGWATFQVMRRTHASLSRQAGIDPKLVCSISLRFACRVHAVYHKRVQVKVQIESRIESLNKNTRILHASGTFMEWSHWKYESVPKGA